MASTIKVNTIQDAGGNTLAVSDGSGNITTNNFLDIKGYMISRIIAFYLITFLAKLSTLSQSVNS